MEIVKVKHVKAKGSMSKYKYRIVKVRRTTSDGVEVFGYIVQQKYFLFFWVAVSPIFDHKDNARHYFYREIQNK
jgi:hypothetical protein